MKFAGADWVKKEDRIMSPVGIKAADVLGQAFQGVYHLFEGAYSPSKVDWSGDQVTVLVGQELASFDAGRLTALILCGRAAGLQVALDGWSRDDTAVSFKLRQDTWKIQPTLPSDKDLSADDFIAYWRLTRSKLGGHRRWERERDRGEGWVKLSIPNGQELDVERMVADAHQACIRVAIRPLSNTSLELTLHKRKCREGSIFERHPDWGTHEKILEPYWSVL